MKNLWKDLKKPLFVLAPMDAVTDVVFREVLTWTHRPDVFYTEFTNVDGLNSKGREATLKRLKYTPNQKPIIAQIWGKTPENFFKSAALIKELGFDGIDINFGCPVVAGSCAALIDNRPLAAQIIQATIDGAGGLPVSVKTRIGLKKVLTEDWIGFLLGFDLAEITVHGRTAAQMSKVPADWDEIAKAVELRNKLKPEVVIIGNGDIMNREDGLSKISKYGVDGVMIGRGLFTDLWAFAPESEKPNLPINEMLDLLLRHARLFVQTWGEGKNFLILRRFFKIYVSGFEGASELRAHLMETKSLADVEEIVKNFRSS